MGIFDSIRDNMREAKMARSYEKALDKDAKMAALREARTLRREAMTERIKKDASKYETTGDKFKKGLQAVGGQLKAMKEKRISKERIEKKIQATAPKETLATSQAGGVFGNMQHRNIHEDNSRNIWEDKPKKTIWD